MSRLESSIDLALSTEIAEPLGYEVLVMPITASESRVVSRGLALHLDILYKGVKRNAGPDRALLQVFIHLAKNITNHRLRSFDIAEALDPDSTALDPKRERTSEALARLLRGNRSHIAGVWLQGQAAKDQLEVIRDDLKDINTLDYFEKRKQGYRQAKNNLVYWEDQLIGLRENSYIERIREAIEESDHGTEV